MIYATVVVVLGLSFAGFGIIYTVRQGTARRSRERADRVIATEGLTALASYQVELLGSTSIARTKARGRGVLVVTTDSLEFRLGYGSTTISIPRSAIIEVTIDRVFKIPGRYLRFSKPKVVALRWRADEREHLAGFASRHATEVRDQIVSG